MVMLCQKGTWGQFPPDILYEPKLDGTRCLAVKRGSDVKLSSRHGTDYTFRFPEIVEALKTYSQDFTLDGEIIGKDYLTLAGRTHLENAFQIRMRSKLQPCDFYAFDILHNGSEMTALPYLKRKGELEKIGENERVKIVKYQPLADLLKLVEEKKIEGVVGKYPYSRYEFRRSPAWVKFRPETSEDLLIVGYEDSDKPTRAYRSLILKRGDREVRASSGLSEKDLEITSQVFAGEPQRQVGTKRYFLNPRFYAEISFYGNGEIPYRFPRVVKVKVER